MSTTREDGFRKIQRAYITEPLRDLRSECFEVVLDTARNLPYAARQNGSVSWRFQAKFVFKAFGHYATSLIALGDARQAENREALGLNRGIRALVPPMDPAGADPAHAQSASETEYKSEVKTFEETYERFESFIRSGQIKRRWAPEDQWCFSRTSWAFRDEA
ncbi:hypothetical protein FS837_011452 [Tulasnella sp. UAMH 9824]|nr:hypothetical protein FS837_011452 [Tulasnella sp. UAMH 9824]